MTAPLPDSTVVSHQMFLFEKGRRMWRDGEPRPAVGREVDGLPDDTGLMWLGWMMARGVDWFKRREVMEKLGIDGEPKIAPIKTKK